MITYRDQLGRPLTAVEVDANFRTLSDRLDVLANPDPGAEPQPAGVPEAPTDGQLYGRKSGSWSVVVTSSGIADAPNDGQPYVRKSGAWAIAASGGSGGTGNVRHLGDWSSSLDIMKWNVVEHDNMLWLAREDFFRQAPAPSFTQDGYWMPIGFPGAYTGQASAGRIQHKFSTPHRNDQVDLATLLNALETRLKAAETKVADHETRISALE